ncbi:cell division protein SepF [bacterium]|nr:cell division protein SepF [bacterium]
MSTFSEKMKVFFGFQEENEGSTQYETKPMREAAVKSGATGNPFKSALSNTGSGMLDFSEIKIEEPRIYEDSLNIATYLRENKPVIINLKYLEGEAGKRLIDFVCGTAYAINGHMRKIGENIFLFTPEKILIGLTQDAVNLDSRLKKKEEKQTDFCIDSESI